MADADRRNRPVPDELWDVRAQIKALEAREEELRGLLLDHPDLRTGANYVAEVMTGHIHRVDIKEMRAMHPDLVAEFTHPVEAMRVVLKGISEDGEITTARRLRAATSGETQ